MVKEICRQIKKSLTKNYFYEVLIKWRLEIMKVCVFGVIVSGAVISLWKLLQFTIVIPSDYIPDENIFDVFYYWNVFLQNAKLHNSGVLAGSGDIHRSLIYCHILNIIILYIGFCCILKICKADAVFQVSYKKFVWLGIAGVIGFIVMFLHSFSEIMVTLILMIFLLVLKRTVCVRFCH